MSAWIIQMNVLTGWKKFIYEKRILNPSSVKLTWQKIKFSRTTLMLLCLVLLFELLSALPLVIHFLTIVFRMSQADWVCGSAVKTRIWSCWLYRANQMVGLSVDFCKSHWNESYPLDQPLNVVTDQSWLTIFIHNLHLVIYFTNWFYSKPFRSCNNNTLFVL